MGWMLIGYEKFAHVSFTEECCKCKKNQHQHQVTINCLDWNTWTWICSDCQKKDVVYFLPHETDFLCVGIN